MRAPSYAPFAVLLVPALVFTAVFAHRPAASPDAEVARLRRHFATVERELLARDVSHLTLAQRAARGRHIGRLRAYARTGVFPKNTDFPGRRVPYFIDRFGTRCAMAHLIEQSGRGEYVQRVAERANNAYIADLARDSALSGLLFAWLEENGLTVDEAARIQPAYCDGGLWVGPGAPPPCPRAPEVRPSVSTGYKMGTGVALTTAVSALAFSGSLRNTGLSRRASGWLSVGAGALGLALGLSRLEDGGDFETLAPLNTAVGALSLAFGAYTLATAPPDAAAPAVTANPTRDPVVRAGPWVTPEGGAGVVLRVTF